MSEEVALIKSLQDDLARASGEIASLKGQVSGMAGRIEEQDATIEKQNGMLEDQHRIIAELLDEIFDDKKRLSFYENAHSPPSKKSLLWKLIKDKQRKDRKEQDAGGKGRGGRPAGRPDGHKGVSHGRKSTARVDHKLDRCPHCEGRRLSKISEEFRQITDAPPPPKAVTTTHGVPTYECVDCGRQSRPETGLIRGTMFGPGILEHIIDLWEMCVSERRIARSIRETYGLQCGKDAVDSALKAVGTALEPESDSIRESLADSQAVHYDETGFSINGRQGQAWLATDGKPTAVVMAGRPRQGRPRGVLSVQKTRRRVRRLQCIPVL